MMETRFLLSLFMFLTIAVNAQEQSGVVKTVGRPGRSGQPLEDVAIRVRGTEVLSVSDEDGKFFLSLAHYSSGQAYSLSRVSKPGYQLADAALIGRRFPYSSEIPLEISMVSNEDYYKAKSEIEAQIRAKVDSEYESSMARLIKDMEERVISAETYKKQRNELLDYYDNVNNLVMTLADRYARTDYDKMDSLDRVINHLIEQGKIDEAEAMIDEKDTKRELEQIRENNRILAQTLEAGKNAEAMKVQEYAGDLKRKYEIASMRFDNQKAAGYLKERMELDSTNYEWKMDYAMFICKYLGRYDEAMAIYRGLLETETDSYLLAELWGCIGTVHAVLGQYSDALFAFEEGVSLKESDSSLRPLLATSYYNIGSIYLSRDMYDDAVTYLNKAESLYMENQDSLGLASVYASRADLYSDTGDFEKSEENLLTALKLRVAALGEDDLCVASNYANLAVLVKKLNKFSKALEYLQKALSINVKILGEHHPEVADNYLSLGSLEVDMGNNANALQYYETALNILNEFYRGEHPDIAQAYNKLAYYYGNVLNDMEKALSYYEQSYEMMMLIYGREHADVALSLNNLAVTYSGVAQFDKALECHNEALSIKIALYGENHYSIGDTYVNIATLYAKLGKNEEARQYTEKALAIFLDFYGEEHSTVALTYNNLGMMLSELGQYQEALNHYAKSIEIYRKVYGDNHNSLATPYDNMGAIYLKHKMYDQAEAYIRESLRIKLESYGDRHSATAMSYNNLSQIYQAKGEYAKAEELLLKVEGIMSDVYGPRHPTVATVYSNLSVLYQKCKDLDKALRYNLQALSIVEENYPSDHQVVMLYRYGLANVYFDAGKNEEAIPYMMSVYRDSYEKKGPDDKYTAHYFMYLHQMYMGAMGAASYDGGLDESYAKLSGNTIITATVAPDSSAEKRGLHGTYQVMSFEDWTLADEETNFFVYNLSVADRPVKTYVLYRDGEYIKVPFEGRLGINLHARWISLEEKEALIKSFKKWNRKRK